MYPVTCPVCGDTIDSRHSKDLSQSILQTHIQNKHPQRGY